MCPSKCSLRTLTCAFHIISCGKNFIRLLISFQSFKNVKSTLSPQSIQNQVVGGFGHHALIFTPGHLVLPEKVCGQPSSLCISLHVFIFMLSSLLITSWEEERIIDRELLFSLRIFYLIIHLKSVLLMRSLISVWSSLICKKSIFFFFAQIYHRVFFLPVMFGGFPRWHQPVIGISLQHIFNIPHLCPASCPVWSLLLELERHCSFWPGHLLCFNFSRWLSLCTVMMLDLSLLSTSCKGCFIFQKYIFTQESYHCFFHPKFLLVFQSLFYSMAFFPSLTTALSPLFFRMWKIL